MVDTRPSVPVIKARGFCKRYKKQLAVEQLDMTVQRGELYGLIGPDGAGKSSLMKAIAGVLTFDEGELEIFGVKVNSEATAEKIKDRIGFMPQGLGLNLYGTLSVEENIDFFARIRQVPPAVLVERKTRLLKMTRLEAFRSRPMQHLSGGMKQKLGLVCALIHAPELLILDEPTTGVDPVSRRDFWAILTELIHEQGMTALISTAYLDEAERFHRLSLMYLGKALAEGEPETIIQTAPGCIVEVVVEPQLDAIEQLKSEFPQVEALGSRIRIFVDDLQTEVAKETVLKRLENLEVKDIHAFEAELEDAFIALLRHRNLVDNSSDNIPKNSSINHTQGNECAIEANGLTRDFDNFRAVDSVNFRIRQGEIFGLLGANGAGKTTAIKMLTGILAPSSGTGRVAGADMKSAGQSIKERIGYMSQAFSLYMDLTALENIQLYAGIYGLEPDEIKERSAWVVEMAGLHGFENKLSRSLPMGIRQRLALGCALVHRPQVIFLDEPTSGVDPLGRRRFWAILQQLSRNENVTILVTTHYMSEAEHCDHLALMYAGHVVADATPSEMKQELQDEAGQLLEIQVDQPQAALALLDESNLQGGTLFGKRIHLFNHQPAQAEQQIRKLLEANDITILKMSKRLPTMEDVFVYQVMTLEKQGAEK